MTHNQPSLRELEREAERNRVELMNTVDALQKRISPSAIKHDVQDYVRGRKDSFVQNLQQRARENPLQTVAIAAGVAYPLWGIITRIPVPLLLIGAGFALTRRSTESQDHKDPSFLDRARERVAEATDLAQQKADEISGTVQNRVNAGMDSARRAGDQLSAYATKASDAAGNIAASIGQKATQSAETLRAASRDAGDKLSPERVRLAGTQASDWINDTASKNPLIVGAVGFALGAIIAAALPSTTQEDKLLGPAADDLKRKAGDAALEGVAAAKEVATEIYQEAASRAKEQGLSVDEAREFTGQVGEKIKTAVANVTGADQQPGDTEYSPQTTSGAAG